MAGIPDHVVELVRERTDVADLVGRYVTLRKAGQRLVGLCPFHSEKSPSFTVNREKQFFYCFGCQANGDIFAFRMRQEGLDFPEAVRALAREAGVEIPETPSRDAGISEALRRLHASAHEFFRERLRASEGQPGRAYLEQRGIPNDLIDRFQLGYAPARWDGLIGRLAQQRERTELAELAGLIGRRQTSTGHYDRFRNRLIFPICDPSGRVVSFGGRALADEKPKYLNSAENPIYRKGRVLFGLHLALDAIRRHGRAVIVEGYFDVIALHRAGIEEGVAPCGTALTRDHAQILRRYAREVVLLFDGDTAGRSAGERSLPLLIAEGIRVRVAFLPSGEDPDTLIARSGPAALRDLVDGAVPFLDHRVDELLGMERAGAWQAADRVAEIAPYLNAIPDPVELAAYVQKVASRLELEPAAVAEAVRRTATAARAPAPASRAAGALPAAADPAEPLELEPAVRALLQGLLSHPQLVEAVDTHEPPFQLTWVVNESSRALLARVLQALRERGERALAWLLGPDAHSRDADALTELAAVEQAPGIEEAGNAVRDCLHDLETGALLRDKVRLRGRLDSCTNAGEKERLFEELESLRSRLGRLDRQHRDERGRTRIATTPPVG